MKVYNPNDTAEQVQQGRLFLIDKEAGKTSFDKVREVRKFLRMKYGFSKIKVGHTGTLDPFATGLLIVAAGKYTKRISEIQSLDKVYTCIIKFGETTETLDTESEISETLPYEHITLENTKRVLEGFIGGYNQMPPIFSAKKINGKRAYDLARAGKEVTVKPSQVEIHDIKILSFHLPNIELCIRSGKGFYVRALARDVAKVLKSCGYLAKLNRDKIGDFDVKNKTLLEV